MVELGGIALFPQISLVAIPLIDRFRLPWLGRRRGWILATQIGLMFAILGLASQMGRDRGLDTAGRDSALGSIAITAVAIAFFVQ